MEYDLLRTPSTDGPGPSNIQIAGARAIIDFRVDDPATYSIDGSLSVLETVGARNMLRVRLTDEYFDGANHRFDVLYDSVQESNMTANVSFSVGGLTGDLINTLTGSSRGRLLPGHDYSLELFARMQEEASTQSFVRGDGTGFFHFSVVPEPSTALLMGFGLAAMAQNARRLREA